MEKSVVEKTGRRGGVLSLEWKRECVIDDKSGGDDSVDPTWSEGERPLQFKEQFDCVVLTTWNKTEIKHCFILRERQWFISFLFYICEGLK